jgi:hypothetical protein
MAEPEIDAVWAEVLRHWDDEAVHRRLVDSARDLEALAEVGRHYRHLLEERPGDPVALRFRDEVVKRANALALASLPRTRPPRTLPSAYRKAVLVAIALGGVATLSWAFLRVAVGGAR